MAQHQAKPALDTVDPVWGRIRREAEETVRREPELATFIYSTILHHDTLETAVVYRLAERLDHSAVAGGIVPHAHGQDLHLHLFDHPAPRHAGNGRGLSAGRAARSSRGVWRTDPAGLCRSSQGHSGAWRGVPRRSHGDRRPRSGDPPDDRAGALLQGFSCHPDASLDALAVAQGPARFRAVSAKPL